MFPVPESFHSQLVAAAMEVAVEALSDLIFFQQVQDLPAGVTLVPGGIVEKHQLLRLPRSLQAGFQPHELPAENLLIVLAGSFFLKKPAPGTANGNVLVKIAVVI